MHNPLRTNEKRRLYWTARGFAGTAADILSLLTPIVGTVGLLISKGFVTAFMAVTLSVMAVTFLVFNFHLQRRFEQESRRAQSGDVLAQCHHHLRNAVVAISREDEGMFGTEFFKASQALAKSFSLATGRPCRVAVKDVGYEDSPEESHVKTLCRSEDYDGDSREMTLPEYVVVKENTDYLRIVQGANEFFSNDLTKEVGYMNSHFDHQLQEHEYPYRSTIVWPIKGPDIRGRGSKPKIIGFLCVDARDPNTFSRRLDVPIGRGVAHAMYAALSLYRDQKEPEAMAQQSGQVG